jgi:CDP-diglyceride synthetase
MKRITKKHWFGPKKIGWGPAPKSWEGGVVTMVWLVCLVSTLFYLHNIHLLNIINIAVVIVVAAIIILTIGALTYGPDEDEEE